MNDQRDGVAAPPDDGGHRGSFSLPTDELQVPDGEASYPPSDQDPAHAGGQGSGNAVFTWAGLFIVTVLFFLAVYGGAC